MFCSFAKTCVCTPVANERTSKPGAVNVSQPIQPKPLAAPDLSASLLADLIPDLSIVIVSWNTRALLAQCLHSIDEERAAYPNLSMEVFVVDNVSHDGSGAMVRQRFPWVQLIENHSNVGFAAGNNQAIEMSRGRYILLLNPDTQVIAGALQALVHFMDTNPQAGAAGSRLLNPDGSLQISCYPRPTLTREIWRLFHLDKLYPYAIYKMQQWWITQPRNVDIVQGASLIVRRDVIEEVGGLDADYFIYSEEVDLCTRIQNANWRIYWVPQSAVIHYGGQSTQQVATEMFLKLYEGKIIYFRKNRGQVAAELYKLILLIASTARLAISLFTWLGRSAGRKRHLQLANNYRRLVFALPRM